jgi:hypothetical protein
MARASHSVPGSYSVLDDDVFLHVPTHVKQYVSLPSDESTSYNLRGGPYNHHQSSLLACYHDAMTDQPVWLIHRPAREGFVPGILRVFGNEPTSHRDMPLMAGVECSHLSCMQYDWNDAHKPYVAMHTLQGQILVTDTLVSRWRSDESPIPVYFTPPHSEDADNAEVILSSAFCRTFPEYTVMSSRGMLYVLAMDGTRSYLPFDTHIDTRAQKLCPMLDYASHPRTLAIGHQQSVSLVDIRSRTTDDLLVSLDDEIRAMRFSTANPFQFVCSTSKAGCMWYDTRYVLHPFMTCVPCPNQQRFFGMSACGRVAFGLNLEDEVTAFPSDGSLPHVIPHFPPQTNINRSRLVGAALHHHGRHDAVSMGAMLESGAVVVQECDFSFRARSSSSSSSFSSCYEQVYDHDVVDVKVASSLLTLRQVSVQDARDALDPETELQLPFDPLDDDFQHRVQFELNYLDNHLEQEQEQEEEVVVEGEEEAEEEEEEMVPMGPAAEIEPIKVRRWTRGRDFAKEYAARKRRREEIEGPREKKPSYHEVRRAERRRRMGQQMQVTAISQQLLARSGASGAESGGGAESESAGLLDASGMDEDTAAEIRGKQHKKKRTTVTSVRKPRVQRSRDTWDGSDSAGSVRRPAAGSSSRAAGGPPSLNLLDHI